MLVDEEEGAGGTEEVMERPLKRKKRYKVSTTIEVSYEEAPCTEILIGLSTGVRARKGSGEATFPSMNKFVDLARIGLDGEPKMECSRALTIFIQGLCN